MIHKFLESHGRSIGKAFSWKIIASLISFFILYRETGDFDQSFKFSVTIFFVGLVAYYLHERVWNAIHWGKHPLSNEI